MLIGGDEILVESKGQFMAYVIAEPCIGIKDTACVDACPVDAIHPKNGKAVRAGAPQLYIQADDCICCGLCVPACPVSAIFEEDDLPEKWKHYVQINRDWFTEGNAGTGQSG
jgi:NAD-dependent dihydropyrimidine dehydrogenase PreA subunit